MKAITFDTFNNTKMSLFVHAKPDLISKLIETNKEWFEQELLMHIARKHHYHGTIIDVGANIGNHSRFLMEYTTFERMICVEPFPDNFEILKANVEHDPRVLPVNAACMARKGVCGLTNTLDTNYGMVAVTEGAGTEVTTVDDLVLDWKVPPVTLLKIDVEGNEVEVLCGARHVLTHHRPMVYAEANHMDHLYRLWEHMCKHRYTCTKYIDKQNPMFEFTPDR